MARSGVAAVLTGLDRLNKKLEKKEKETRRAAHSGVKNITRRVQLRLRRRVNQIFSGGTFKRSSRKGGKVGNAIRSKVYDNRRRGSAGLVYSKFGKKSGGKFIDYLGPYLTGKDILPKKGRFMAIPLQRGKKNRKPENFSDLDVISTGGKLYLIRNTRSRTTFMFLLLRRVKIRHRLRAAKIARREFKRLPGAITRKVRG